MWSSGLPRVRKSTTLRRMSLARDRNDLAELAELIINHRPELNGYRESHVESLVERASESRYLPYEERPIIGFTIRSIK